MLPHSLKMSKSSVPAFVTRMLSQNLDVVIQSVRAPSDLQAQGQPEHNASCNSCSSRIRGDRYKCVGGCPDFDFCSDCFSITVHRVYHNFVRLPEASFYLTLQQNLPRSSAC
ncbi:hypothetical protein B0H10DRAFT_2060831 [Mycena sp. CBHHK59/15]|nr:hypothetical protein B0H10DRAFT_2060831 [Mycena sp. CBHHK59/15]